MAATQLRVAAMLIIAAFVVNSSPIPEYSLGSQSATASPLVPPSVLLYDDPKSTVSTTVGTTTYPKYRRDATETTTEEKTTAASWKPISTSTQHPDKVRREDTKGQPETTPLSISTPSILGWTRDNAAKVTTTESSKYRLRRSGGGGDDVNHESVREAVRDCDSDSDSRSDSDESTESVKKVPVPVKRETYPVEGTTAIWNARDKTNPTTAVPAITTVA